MWKQTNDEERWWARPVNLDKIAPPSIQDQRPGLFFSPEQAVEGHGIGNIPYWRS